MRLISMTDFVLCKDVEWITYESIYAYALFLKKPLDLWMFVPCDEDWNILEKPEENDLNDSFLKMQINYDKEVKWEIAKERCLFEGFKILDKGNFYFIEQEGSIIFYRVLKNNSKATIEDLLKFREVILTKTAIKQIEGL